MKCSTSIICANQYNLKKDLDFILSQSDEYVDFNYLHADFMDGHFVPRYGMIPELLKCIRDYNKEVIIDSHLMVDNPIGFVEVIAPYSNIVTFHYEAVTDPMRVVQYLRKNFSKVKVGIAFNTMTDFPNIFPRIQHYIDYVMFMGISPGVLGSENFIEVVLGNLEIVDKLNKKNNTNVKTIIDGSVSIYSMKLYKRFDPIMICGSSTIFKNCSNTVNVSLERETLIKENIDKIKEIARGSN